MLKILWVSHFIPYPPTGGVLQRGYGLISRLSRLCEVHLLAMHQPRLFRQTGGRSEKDRNDAIGALQNFCASVETVDIPSEIYPAGRAFAAVEAVMMRKSYTERWLASRSMRRAIALKTQKIQPEIVHLDTISLAPYLIDCSGDASISLGHHNIESHMMWRRAKKARSRLTRSLLHVEASRILELEKLYAPRVDLNVVCSELDGRRLRRLTRTQNVHVAENGVMDAEANLETSAQEAPATRLLFIGRMSAYTNKDAADFLVQKIWPAVSSRSSNLTLDIVGSGAPKSAIELAKSDSRVKVHGFVPNLSTILSSNCIFVCPVRDGGGTKLKVLDAMNRGLAIVAHPTAMEGINANDGKHILLAKTAEDFADAIVKLVKSPDQRRALVANSLTLVREHYAFDAIAKKLHSQFISMASRRNN